mmetsp:Transcript_5689/g.23641  ORF Transcript_5689/g.23641 Transcript_5689/m.23641 type:complete len:486 (-) Transcript_5689:190-1647(-)
MWGREQPRRRVLAAAAPAVVRRRARPRVCDRDAALSRPRARRARRSPRARDGARARRQGRVVVDQDGQQSEQVGLDRRAALRRTGGAVLRRDVRARARVRPRARRPLPRPQARERAPRRARPRPPDRLWPLEGGRHGLQPRRALVLRHARVPRPRDPRAPRPRPRRRLVVVGRLAVRDAHGAAAVLLARPRTALRGHQARPPRVPARRVAAGQEAPQGAPVPRAVAPPRLGPGRRRGSQATRLLRPHRLGRPRRRRRDAAVAARRRRLARYLAVRPRVHLAAHPLAARAPRRRPPRRAGAGASPRCGGGAAPPACRGAARVGRARAEWFRRRAPHQRRRPGGTPPARRRRPEAAGPRRADLRGVHLHLALGRLRPAPPRPSRLERGARRRPAAPPAAMIPLDDGAWLGSVFWGRQSVSQSLNQSATDFLSRATIRPPSPTVDSLGGAQTRTRPPAPRSCPWAPRRTQSPVLTPRPHPMTSPRNAR